MSNQSDYGKMLLNTIEENDCDASVARYVFAHGAKLFQDGNEFCCLIGNDLQDGFATFGKSPKSAIEKMSCLLSKGDLAKIKETK